MSDVLTWSSLSDSQKSVLKGGEQAWNSMPDVARFNFYAITHALEITPLATGASCLSEIQPGSSVMREDCREMNTAWQPGTKEAFKLAGFKDRIGSPTAHHDESGIIKPPASGGHADIQGIHVLFDNSDQTKGDIHIDYLWGIGHWEERNDDVTRNLKEYEKWYGEFPARDEILHPVPAWEPLPS